MPYIVRSLRARIPHPSSESDSRMWFVLGRPVEGLVQKLMGCFTVYAELAQFEGEAIGSRRQSFTTLAKGLGVEAPGDS